LQTVEVGKGVVRRQGKGVAILAFGTLLHPALAAAEAIDATVADMRWVKPLDQDLIRELAAGHSALVTVEEGALMGGAGSAVLEALAEMGLNLPVLCLGVPDVFTEHGDPKVLLQRMGLDAEGILARIKKRFGLNSEHQDSAADSSDVVPLKRVV
jgi:1-deoxy-D-xylulose-5-phosphate synthase